MSTHLSEGFHRTWLRETSVPPLDQGELHVWLIDLEEHADCMEQLRHSLAPLEQARAARFRFEPDQVRYVVAHGALRRILAGYLDLDPRSVGFETNAYGKPALTGREGEELAFNLSHSERLALIAVGRNGDIGVDVECIRPDMPFDDLAGRFFAPGEVSAIRTLTGEARRRAFYRCWTRKEAFIKARGMGLTLPLDSFEVSVLPEAPPAILAIRDASETSYEWSLRELDPGPGYIGCLAVHGPISSLRLMEWGF